MPHALAFHQVNFAIRGGFAKANAQLVLEVVRAIDPPPRAQGKLVQTVILYLPTGFRSYML